MLLVSYTRMKRSLNHTQNKKWERNRIIRKIGNKVSMRIIKWCELCSWWLVFSHWTHSEHIIIGALNLKIWHVSILETHTVNHSNTTKNYYYLKIEEEKTTEYHTLYTYAVGKRWKKNSNKNCVYFENKMAAW